MALALSPRLEAAGYVVRFQRSSANIREEQPPPTAEELRACVALFEQVDAERFPRSGELPADCGIVRFPSLDTNLLWPFGAMNPYDATCEPDFPDSRYPHGDRILLRCIEKDWDAPRIVDYYLSRYEDYRVDLTRVAALERARRSARDAKSDVTMMDALGGDVAGPLFWSCEHPRPPLLRTLATRLARAGTAYVPELRDFEPALDAFERYDDTALWSAVPIHPGVAAELGLTWYDPGARYIQPDGSRPTFEEYVRGFVVDAIANRRRQLDPGTRPADDRRGWRPPLQGPARCAGPVLGIYPDAFAAPLMRFELEASAPLVALVVDAYYPPQQLRAATVSWSAGDATAETRVEPGTPFSLQVPMQMARGERVRVRLTCSETLNMFERGESEDDRDLGALILNLRAVPAGAT